MKRYDDGDGGGYGHGSVMEVFMVVVVNYGAFYGDMIVVVVVVVDVLLLVIEVMAMAVMVVVVNVVLLVMLLIVVVVFVVMVLLLLMVVVVNTARANSLSKSVKFHDLKEQTRHVVPSWKWVSLSNCLETLQKWILKLCDFLHQISMCGDKLPGRTSLFVVIVFILLFLFLHYAHYCEEWAVRL